jgi:deoxyhypusine synthase
VSRPCPKSRPATQPADRDKTDFSTGEDLIPLEGMELAEVEDFDGMLTRMASTSFQGRNLGKAAEVLELMFSEPDNLVVLTISGALTVAQQGPVFVELIRSGLVHVVVGTGALLTHDVLENLGFSHYAAPAISDAEAAEKGLCRVYDSVELETSFDAFDKFLEDKLEDLLPSLTGGEAEGSAGFCRRLGQLLLEHFPQQRSILSAAAEMGVPVYIPAFTDSEMALDVFNRMVQRNNDAEHPLDSLVMPPFNQFVDLLEYTRLVESHRKGQLCIFTLGGGAPRNWAQQVAPTLDLMKLDGLDVHAPLFSRGVRICPDPPHWGHLSGCTYSEGVSWAKFTPAKDGGRFAEVLADATLVLPLLVKGVLQRLEKRGRSRPGTP